MNIYYFAYGSNMLSKRMLERIPEAKVEGIACLPGWKLVWDKISKDGSGKANLRREDGKVVWGVIYLIPESRVHTLDEIEGGYQRIDVEVQRDQQGKLAAFTYVSEKRDESLLPFERYKELVIKGAQEHSLPSDYIDEIKQAMARPDSRDKAGK